MTALPKLSREVLAAPPLAPLLLGGMGLLAAVVAATRVRGADPATTLRAE